MYKADPFEIVPNEVYKNYDYIVRDDLWFSQIKKDYPDGYKGFSKNAERELGFLQGLKEDAINKTLSESKDRIKENNRLNFAIQYGVTPEVIEKLSKKIDEHKNNIDYYNNRVQELDTPINKARQRYALLKQLDNLALKKEEKENKYKYCYDKKKKSEIEKVLYFIGIDMDKLVKKIEKFYKENYPDWV